MDDQLYGKTVDLGIRDHMKITQITKNEWGFKKGENKLNNYQAKKYGCNWGLFMWITLFVKTVGDLVQMATIPSCRGTRYHMTKTR